MISVTTLKTPEASLNAEVFRQVPLIDGFQNFFLGVQANNMIKKLIV